MKRFLILITIALMIKAQNGMANMSIPVVAQTRHVTKNVRAHGKPKLRLKSTIAINPPTDPEELIVDDDIVFGRNRNRIEIVRNTELSDYVKIRLALARMKALNVYKQRWG
jgi:hypothetical protein